MANQLLIIVGPPPTHCGKIAYGINVLNDKGIKTALIDVSGLKKLWRVKELCWKSKLPDKEYIEIKNRCELRRFVKSNVDGRTACLFLFLPARDCRYIWKEFNKGRPKIGMIIPGARPWDESMDESALNGARRYKKLKIIYRKTINRLKPRLDLWVLSGEKCIEQYAGYFNGAESARKVWAHNFDYESYLTEIQQSPDSGPIEKRTAVYIDQAFTTHPDRYLNKLGDYVTESNFRCRIQKLLDEVNEDLGFRCIIVGHPKGGKEQIKKMYKPYEVEFGTSLRRIKESELVISHSSTALQLAIFLKKRILLFTTDELVNSKLHPINEGFRRELGIPVINIDKEYNIRKVFDQSVISCDQYQSFIRNYIKVDLHDNRSIWEIIGSEIKAPMV